MRRPHAKHTFRLDKAIADRLAERAQQRRVSRTEIVEAALLSLLSPDQDERLEALVTRRLDRLSRQVDRLEWQIELSNETIALFIRFWLTANPPLPDDALRAAQAIGRKRWEAFIDSLSRRMAAGPKLKDELADDVSRREA